MTREMIKQVENDYWKEKADPIDMAEVFDLANKALEQEPQSFEWCDTCKEYDQENHCCHRWSKVIRNTVEEMKQEPKTGHWIDCDNSDDYSADGYDCSVCGVNAEYATSYCPNCGCRIGEPQESEDKE